MRRSLSCSRSALLTVLFSLVLLALSQRTYADSWPVAHGNPSNTAYFGIPTSAALSPAKIISGIGTFADGYSPVMWGGTGAVVLANQQGKVMMFSADGAKLWERQLPSGFGVTTGRGHNGNPAPPIA